MTSIFTVIVFLLFLFPFFHHLQRERLQYQNDYMDAISKLEEQWAANKQKHENEKAKVSIALIRHLMDGEVQLMSYAS